MKAATHRFVFATMVLLPLVLSGCSGGKSEVKKSKNASKTSTSREHLDKALSFLNRADEYDRRLDFVSRLIENNATGQSLAREQILFHLSFWAMSNRRGGADWQRDPLIARLPVRMLALPLFSQGRGAPDLLAKVNFNPPDITFLEEAKWFRDVARFVASKPMNPALKKWRNSGLSADAFQRLLQAERLFDWTIRNIQLDALPPPPKTDPNYRLPIAAKWVTDPRVLNSGSIQGLPGPGYTMRPWEVLLFGHGDAWMRGRVFIYLCRQLGIDSVMLGVRRGDDEVPWAVGVLLDKRAYVFDMALGLPIPAEAPDTIAHVEQLLKKPELLRRLDHQDMVYPITAEDLKRVGGLIDAAAGYLSRKWFALQSQLTGKNQIVLSYAPSQTARTLNSTAGIRWSRIWDVPIDCLIYVSGRHYRDRANVSLARLHEVISMQGYNPLILARQLHLAGQFADIPRETGQESKPGAMSRYLEARLSDRRIALIRTDQSVQRDVGLSRGDGELDDSWEDRLNRREKIYKQAKYHSTYWIGLAHFDRAAYESAVHWLANQTLRGKGPSPWVHGARYNLARTYEALQQYDKARAIYEQDKSPQRHGNLLRAKRLPAETGKAKPPKKSDAKKSDGKKAETKKPETKKPETKKTETKKPETKKTETKKTEAKKTEAKKTEAKKTEAKKTEAKKPETKKTEAKKTEAKKADTKKADGKKAGGNSVPAKKAGGAGKAKK